MNGQCKALIIVALKSETYIWFDQLQKSSQNVDWQSWQKSKTLFMMIILRYLHVSPHVEVEVCDVILLGAKKV